MDSPILNAALQESIRKQSDRVAKVSAREQSDRRRTTSTGKFIGYDAASGKHHLELPDGSIVATDYESNSGVAVGEVVGLVAPKYSLIGKSYKLPK